MSKVGNSTSPQTVTQHVPQTDDSNKQQQVKQQPSEATENPFAKASVVHATQKMEQQKLEGSIRQAEIQGSLMAKNSDKDSKASKKPTDAEIRDLKYEDNYFTDANELKAPAGTEEMRILRLQKKSARSVNESDEEAIVEKHGRGRLVTVAKADVQPGQSKKDIPMTVTVHGINGSPDDVKALSKNAAKRGGDVKTFAYDDQHTRLGESSKQLAGDLGKWLKENPGRPLRVDAHSMGGRIALDALSRIPPNLLKGRKVELNLVASPINGTTTGAVANVSGNIPVTGPLIQKIPTVTPGVDMAPFSGFQDRLNNIKLPDNVKVRIFTGGNDDVVNQNDSFDAMARRLNAERVHFPNADHETAVGEAARWLSKHDGK